MPHRTQRSQDHLTGIRVERFKTDGACQRCGTAILWARGVRLREANGTAIRGYSTRVCHDCAEAYRNERYRVARQAQQGE